MTAFQADDASSILAMRSMKVTVPVTNQIKEEAVGKYRRIVYGYAPSLDLDCVNINSLIEQLKEFNETYGDDYDSLEFRVIRNCGCWDSCSCSKTPVLYGTRDESELETNVKRKI